MGDPAESTTVLLPSCFPLLASAPANIDKENCEKPDEMEQWLKLNGTVTCGPPLFIWLLVLISVNLEIRCIFQIGTPLPAFSALFGFSHHDHLGLDNTDPLLRSVHARQQQGPALSAVEGPSHPPGHYDRPPIVLFLRLPPRQRHDAEDST